ncbi:hypothetical protein LI328DRAFT_44083 [Trichoderma asperelloides]|nr:hypothetical protein LI328DRAFT_44083 [Trichoderma asperelloides]
MCKPQKLNAELICPQLFLLFLRLVSCLCVVVLCRSAALNVSLFVLVFFYILAGAPLPPFLPRYRQIPLSLTESHCPVSLRFSALTPLLRPARSDAARIQTRLAFCFPREGLTKP